MLSSLAMRGRQIAAVGNYELDGASALLRRSSLRGPRSSSSGEVAAAIAHEIRTPLAVALMYLRLVEDEAGPLVKESVRDGFSIARAEVARLDRLLTDLVDLHRVGHVTIRPSLVDAGRVVSDAVRRVLRDLSAGQVTVELGAADLLDWWDVSVLERIVESLVVNATHHGDGRSVSVAVDRVDSGLRLCLRDASRVAVAEASPRALRRRLGPRKARGSGPGTNLWLIQELAEAHGGGVTGGGRDGAGPAFTVTLRPRRP
jgi:two-component system sensor histidine kinase FlrB